jgi:ABC-type dipeptide/oligopeptide/nickel transport system ATPase subunit
MGQDFQSDFQDKLASEDIKKLKRGQRLDANMELILQRKLTSPKPSREILDILSDGLYELNIERKKSGKSKLSTRAIPPLSSLPKMLKVNPNIKVIPPSTSKGKALYIWRR